MYHVNTRDPASWERAFAFDWEADEYATVLVNCVADIDVWVDTHSDAFSKRYVVKWEYK